MLLHDGKHVIFKLHSFALILILCFDRIVFRIWNAVESPAHGNQLHRAGRERIYMKNEGVI